MALPSDSSNAVQVAACGSCAHLDTDRSPVESPSKGHHSGKREMAKQWTYYVETLKTSTDCLYEICRKEQSIIGCKEALLYLTNSVRDFESLIDSINVEVSWEEEAKPHAVAWEIRKTTSPPGKVTIEPPNKLDAADTLINAIKLSPVVVHDLVRNAESKLTAAVQSAAVIGDSTEEKENLRKEHQDMNKQEPSLEDGWLLVTARNKRRKSNGGTSNTSSSKEVSGQSVHLPPPKRCTMNVYERLSRGVLRPPNPAPRTVNLSGPSANAARLTCPRSAMDLPQTKASMAKMAYSRQLLWQKHQPLLAEKMLRRRRRDRDLLYSRKAGGSVPALSAINFADPVAVTHSAEAFKHRQQMQNASRSAANVNRENTSASFERIEELPVENEDRENAAPAEGESSKPTPSCMTLARSASPVLSCPTLPEGMDPDDAWRAMTEEEESLVQEEQSLKKEIEEEESVSIDDELERQVAAEAAALEQAERNSKLRQQQEAETEEKKAPFNIQELFNSIKREMEEYASVSWSEIVEREITHYRKPGEFAQMHEKLSSPSRKRNQDDATRRHIERQQRAEELRQMLLEKKAKRLKELSNKVEEVRCKRAELIERIREHLQKRMEKAEENRQKSIDEIVKKAHDGDLKVMEISFINKLEAGNMRHDVMVRSQEWEHRAQSLAAERAKKNEEKAAKEAAAEERRRIADAERNERLREREDRKRARQAELENQRLEQERERAAAKEKQRQCVERAAEKKAEEAAVLKKKIEQKQEETRRRYEETITQVKQRAVELSSPRCIDVVSSLADFSQIPSENPYISSLEGAVGSGHGKKCTICEQKVKNDLDTMAHLLSDVHISKKNMSVSDITYEYFKAELETNIVEESDAAKSVVAEGDQQKHNNISAKKRRARLRQKIIAKSKEFESTMSATEAAETFVTRAPRTCSLDKPVRDLVKAVKGAVGEFFVDCCNGTVRANYQGMTCDAEKVHIIERAILDIQRSLPPVDCLFAKNLSPVLRSANRLGLLDALIVIISKASNDETIVPFRTQDRAADLLSSLMRNNGYFWAKTFYTNRVLVVLDAVSSKLKLFSNPMSSHDLRSSSLSIFFLVFVILLGCNDASMSASFGITDTDFERLKMLLSLLAQNSFADHCCGIIQQSGPVLMSSGTKWELNKHMKAFLTTVEMISTMDEVLAKGDPPESSRECSPASCDGSAAEKNASIFAVALPTIIQHLASRAYSQLVSEMASPSGSVNCTTQTCSSEGSGVMQFESAFSSILIEPLTRLWIILARREPAEARTCLRDGELTLRLAHIFTCSFLEHKERDFAPLCAGNGGTGGRAFTGSLRNLILSIGYFASLDVRAQVLCILGWQRSLLAHLCSLPLAHFSNQTLMGELLPTLCAICYNSKKAVEQLKLAMSPLMLANFLKEAKAEEVPDIARFPKKFWQDAISYFEQQASLSVSLP